MGQRGGWCWNGRAWMRADWTVAADGRLQAGGDSRHAPRGWLLPGVPNLHSHAFQRAMVGMAEAPGDGGDDFWRWRQAMYRCAARFDPDSLRVIATQLYVEMLEAGYTHVCEFHYLHNTPDGRPYAEPAAMALALIEAARQAGIGLTLLPTLYQRGGFDDRPLSDLQARFFLDTDAYCALIERLAREEGPRLRVGIALHSLRAVDLASMQQVLTAVGRDRPVHIHVAEQVAEIEDCQRLFGTRPVRWLLDHLPLDARWALVHATHCTHDELRDLAATGAGVVLCPSTEANLGDGLFDLPAWLAHGGRFGIGSDSQVTIAPDEELRWLEYGQRLRAERRIVASRDGDGVAHTLLRHAWAVAAMCGVTVGRLASDARLDAIELAANSPTLAGADRDDVFERWIFANRPGTIARVWVDGRLCVEDGRHRDRALHRRAFVRSMQALWRA